MGDKEGVLEAKLDILIEDFQRFRQEQATINRELSSHSAEENKVQAGIATTQRWHKVIGTFMMGVMAYHLSRHGL